jgi:hypothetical protein
MTYIPNDEDIQAVVDATGMEWLQARNSLIGKFNANEHYERERHQRLLDNISTVFADAVKPQQ